MKKDIFNIILIALILSVTFGSTSQVEAQCTINKSNCPPSDLITTNANTVVNGVLGAVVTWTPPTFSLSCPSEVGTGFAFVTSFDLPESQNGCWDYNKVQRIGTAGGKLRLWQSTGTGNTSFTTPSFFLPTTATNGSMTITNGSGEPLTCNVYLVNPDGTLSAINTTFSINGSAIYNFSITPAQAGIYRLFFEFTGNGSNKDDIELLKINALLYGTSCAGDINFYTVSTNTPGNFFPVGSTPVTYTATCNSCTPVISETCTFNVIVNGVTASSSKSNADCGLNNGIITITATSSNTSPVFQYNLNNTGWVNFSTPGTITGLNQATYSVDVRDYFSNISGCQLLTPLSVIVGRNIDVTKPLITCPAPRSINGCNVSDITVANTGLVYSSTLQTITSAQFTTTGASATDSCGVTSWKYQDSQSGTSPIIVSRTFTVTDNSGNTSSCTQTITINPVVLSANIISTNVTCNGANNGSVTINGVTSGSGTYEYSINGGSNWQSGNSFTNLSNATYNVVIRDIVPTSCISTLNSSLVITQPSVLTISAISANTPICQGSTLNLTTTPTGGTLSYTYLWNGPNSFTSNTQNPIITNVLLLNSGTYSATVTDANGCTTSANTTVSVNLTPTVNHPADQIVCNGSPISAVSFSGTATTYNWINDTPSIGLPASGSGNIASFTATNTGTTNSLATITVTPIYSAGGLDCPGISQSFTITVHPTPIVIVPSDQTYCNGQLTTIIPLTGTPTGVVFDITGGTVIGLTNKTGVTEIPAYTAKTGTATISITPRANGCTGPTATLTITVFPTPNVSTIPATQTICSQGPTNITLTSGTLGATFSWTVGTIAPAGSITGATSSTGNKILQTLTNSTASDATVTYVVTPTANGCNGSPVNVVITVRPPTNLIINNPAAICSPATVDLTASTITTGSTLGLTLSYWNDAAATISMSYPTTATSGTYYIKAMEPLTGCYIIKPAVIIVNPTPTVVITNPAPVCAPNTVNLTLTSVTSGSTPGLTFTYYTDAAATITYSTPTIADDDIYYIKGSTASGCYDLKPVNVSVYSTLGIPVFALGVSSNICKGSAPITYTATATNAITITYSLDAASLAAGNTINASTGLVTYSPTWTGTSLITATATGCGTPTTAIHTVKVNPPPTVTLVASPSTAVCEGTPVTLTATSSGSSSLQTYSGSSGNITTNIPDHSNSSYTYPTITLSGSNGATLASTDLIVVTININHHYASDLDIFLVDPSGNKAMLLSSDNGGSSNDYINTVFRTDASNPITGGSAPFTGTYLPEGSITTAPDRSGAVSGGTYNSVIPASSLNGALIDGAWSLRVFDDNNNDSGSFANWSLSISKQTGSNFTSVVNGSPTIGAITYSGALNSIATSFVTPPAGTNNYTVTTTDGNGCSATSNTVAVVVNAKPNPTIIADYCSHQPKINLITSGGGTYLWSTGETTSSIDVDLVGIYTVTVTGVNGCKGSAALNISNELVTNGDFSAGNTGFSTPASGANQYSYVADGAGNTELNPEGLYGVGTNGNNYHTNFWGVDHTTGTGKFMIVNGFPGTPQPVVWQQTKTVLPNTDYYFSAYAISLNNAGNYAQLRFSINGTQIGTIAALTAGTGSNSNPWKAADRFYGMWNSGINTSAIIEIVDLQTALGGNDFGLDDISFGTLAPSPATINPTTATSTCEGATITLAANVVGGKTPFTYSWTALNGFNSPLQNPTIPNCTTAHSGVYTLTFTDGYGCTALTKTVTVTVDPLATVNAGVDQSVCAASPSVTLAGVIGGSSVAGIWTGGTGTFLPNRSALTAIYTPSTNEINAGTVSLTLTNISTNSCAAKSDQMKITIYPAVTATISASNSPLCNGGSDGYATVAGSGGTLPYLYSWNTSPVQTTATANNLSAGTYIVTVTTANGCTDTETITLSDPPKLVVDDNLQIIEPSCFGANNGTATVTIISGTSPTILWSDGQTTATASGLTAGIYTITVALLNGCSATVLTAVITQPEAPTILCPSDITVQADVNSTVATNVSLSAPGYTNDCPMTVERWEMTGVTTDNSLITGINLLTTHNFNVGQTSIKYTIIDGVGNSLNCTFKVTVLPQDPPEITCPSNISQNADLGLCSAAVTIIPATSTGNGVTITGVRSDGLQLTDTYPVGTTTITWTAANITGTDICMQTIVINDNQLPTFTQPDAISECVERLNSAIYNAPTTDINPDRPDYYTFQKGNASLDLDPLKFIDNCPLTCAVEIRWKIDMNNGTRIPALPTAFLTGQPSAYSSDIQFLGDGASFTNVNHTITYWIVDCSGNVSLPKTQTITIKPRPQIIKGI